MHQYTIELQPMQSNAENKEVLLSELNDAYQHIEGQHSFLKMSGSVFVAIISIGLGILTLNSNFLSFIVSNQNNFIMCYGLLLIILFLFLLYIIDSYKEIVFYSRKAIVVRRQLGVEYGNYSYPIPNWSIVGADNPFAIRMFPGWSPRQSMSILFWTITCIGLAPLILFFNLYSNGVWWGVGGAGIALLVLFCTIFRTRLYDRHESLVLSLGLTLAKMLRLPVSSNIEQDLYMAKLSYSEVLRNNSDDDQLKKLIVEVEDKKFFSHKGVSFKSIARGIVSNIPIVRKRWGFIKSGGSTVEMQISRTLFIKDFSKQLRRKVIEIVLAKWLYGLHKKQMLTKTDILDLYLSAVQYGPGVIGFLKAKEYYFASIEYFLNDDDRVLLVDRLSSGSALSHDTRLNFIEEKARAIGMKPVRRTPLPSKKESF